MLFVLLGISTWAGVQTTYVVTKTKGTCYKLESSGELTVIASGFGSKFVSTDEVLSFASEDNTVNWGFDYSNGDINGFRVRQGYGGTLSALPADAVVTYTLSVPADYTIVSYTLGTANAGGSVDAGNGIKISLSPDMSDFTTVQKSAGNSYTQTLSEETTETKFYLQHANGDNPIDVTLTVVVEASKTPEEVVAEYLTEDKIANINKAGQCGYPKTTTQTYQNIKSIFDKLTQPDAAWTNDDAVNVQAYYEAYLAETDIVFPEAGKFYRIYVDNGERRKYLSANGTGVNGTTSTDFDASFIWYFNEHRMFTAFSTGYQIADVALGCNNGTTTVITKTSGFGKFNVESGTTLWFIQISMEADENLKSGSSSTLPGASFSFEEVDQLPLTLDNVDGTYYTTLTLPVDATLEGVSAYAPTLSEGGYFVCTDTLTAIPANTPVVLIGESENATATVSATVSPAETTNTLSGTMQAIANREGQNVYVLSVDDSNNLGFYKYEGENIPGFKAYYVGTAPEADGYILKFADDNITGIVSAENAAAAAQTHYDLQGRRVTAPQKGQLYIVNGKKVLY